jgi:dihydrodipicolinate synthase/N-acetylneuraminate lyase
VGLKVSDTPWERFEPYLIKGLDVFVGPEALIHQGLGAGAVGAVSALAAAFPELVVRLVADPSEEAGAHVGHVRAAVSSLPFQAALKAVLALRGVPVREDVRAPLRTLDAEERNALERIVHEVVGGLA